MARVHLTSCYLRIDGPERCLNEYRRLEECMRLDRTGAHEPVDRPDDADLVIFAELSNFGGGLQERLQRDSVFVRAVDRSVHFNPRLKQPPAVAGIYGSAVKRWCHPGHAVTSHYLETSLERDFIQPESFDRASYLFSFCGSSETWQGRRQILELSAHNALLIDSATADVPRDAYRDRYVRSLSESKFVLCPRGIGPASLRVFEVLKAGRVPVVIADDWLPPAGPDWEGFSVTIAESDISSIPAVLAERESMAEEMAKRALEVHRDWFAADVSFHRIVEWALQIQERRETADATRHRRQMRLRYQAQRFRESARAVVNRLRP